MKTYFYYLRDPRDNQIKYIGQSKNPKARHKSHIYMAKQGRDKNSRKVRWIMCLVRLDMIPVLEIFEEYLGNVNAAHKREWALIKEHISKGCDLVNGNDGGAPYILPDARVKPVYQYEKETGVLIKKYRCSFDAYSETGIKDANISRACIKEGLRQSFPGNFIWSFNQYDMYPLNAIPESMSGGTKKILATKGTTSVIYKSARDAARVLDIDYRQISDCARGKQKTCKGYTFSFVDHDIVRSSSKDVS